MSKGKKATKTEAVMTGVKKPSKLNASQTIQAMGDTIATQSEHIQILADEIDKLRQMLTSLNKRMNASIQAAEEGSLNTDSVNKIILQENMKELEGKVEFLVKQGVLSKNDESEISEKTFIVGREVDTDGNVVNPRVQFAVGSVDKTVQDQLLTKKMGDMIKYSDTEPSLEIVEVYDITQPAIKKNYEATAPAPQ